MRPHIHVLAVHIDSFVLLPGMFKTRLMGGDREKSETGFRFACCVELLRGGELQFLSPDVKR